MSSESKTGKHRRFKNQYPVHLFQNVDRFEGSLHLHCRHAVSVIDRVKGDGREYFEEGSKQLRRWQEYCQTLKDFLSRDLATRKHAGQDLDTVLREYFQEFEHSSFGLDEMLHGPAFDSPNNDIVVELWDWLALAFRESVYAIVAYWVPDKKETAMCHMQINLTTGVTRQEWAVDPMIVPKKYKRATKKP